MSNDQLLAGFPVEHPQPEPPPIHDHGSAIIETESDALAPRTLAIDPDHTEDQARAMMLRFKGLEQRFAAFKAQFLNSALDWCVMNGDLTVGAIRYYAGDRRVTKLRDGMKAHALDAILDAVDGDMDHLAELLAAQPIKHGAASKVLSPAVFAELFETIEKPELRDGKPVKRLMSTNDDYTKEGGSADESE